MFDDQQPQNAGAVPPNLPIGEPEDIFSNSDDTVVVSGAPVYPQQPAAVVSAGDEAQQDAAPTSMPEIPSALHAGALRPKAVGEEPTARVDENIQQSTITPRQNIFDTAMQPNTDLAQDDKQAPPPNNGFESDPPHVSVPPPNSSLGMTPTEDQGAMYSVKEPLGNRSAIVWIAIIIIIIVLGAGSVWVYLSFIKDNTNSNTFIPTIIDNGDITDSGDTMVVPGGVRENNQPAQDTQNKPTLDEQILFGEPIDTDGDGLSDIDEVTIWNTDPLNWDTDGDGLSDGDEVLIWKTDPLNPDTDGDGYSDGDEIKNGYSPTGPGKLFEPPTSTQEGT